ncbi:hypothetical protein OKW50_004930 [Paraburkholderia youngii]|uniref:restriction endonuclease subunit S n=1 Tax=Paraburkholderia youngii TaxID=2782701 RepID=UPI003D22133C
MNESRRIQVAVEHLHALGYPRNSIETEVEAGRGRRLDGVVFHMGRAAVVIEVKGGDSFPHADDKLLPFNASVRQAQFAAMEVGAPFYVLTNGADFLWFETDPSGRPAMLSAEKRFEELVALFGERDEREQRAASVHRAVRQLLEMSYAQSWPPEALPLLLYAYLQSAQGDAALYEYLAQREHGRPPVSLIDVHDVLLRQDRAISVAYRQGLEILSVSRLDELSPREALQTIDNLMHRSSSWHGSLRVPRWTADLMVRLARIGTDERVLDLNGGMGNLPAAVRMNGVDARQLTVCVLHSSDALWTAIQQLPFGTALPIVYVGNQLQAGRNAGIGRAPMDCILIAPPFGATVQETAYMQANGRPLASEEAYIHEALSLLSPTGRIVALVPNGALSSPLKKTFRDEVLRQNGLVEVFDVGTFLPGSGVTASIVVLDRSKAGAKDIFFANAQYRGQDDHFDCREVPGLARVIARSEAWGLGRRNDFPVDDEGLSAVAEPGEGVLNAAPYLARQAQLEMPFASFEHVYLDSVAEVTKGAALTRDSTGSVAFIGPGSIRPLQINLDPADRASENQVGKFPKAVVVAGDIVLNGLSTYLAAAALIEAGQYPINRHVFRIRVDPEKVLPAYLAIAINSRYVRDSLRQGASGSTMKMLTLDMLRHAIIPVPPLAIQHDIVYRVSAARAERDAAAEGFRERELALKNLIEGLGAGDAA